MKIISTLKQIKYKILTPLFPEMVHKWRVLDSSKYNMYSEENEVYYAQEYLHVIKNKLQHFDNRKLRILDVGCGQGRLSIPLAEMDNTVEGVDLSSNAIQLAKKYASEKNITNIHFDVKDITKPFNDYKSEKYDCILCTEVIYMIENYEEVLAELYRMVKKDGMIFVAFRDKYYYLLHAIKNRRFEDAKLILSNKNGVMGGYLNWHTNQEILNLVSSFNLKNIELYGIGICSGIEGDPLSSIVEPQNITPDEQEILFEIEMTLSTEYSNAGRYVLMSAIK
ncbi:MAG: methyltransferase domain-containing protein [Euryarchaeota archaeon]|nr:methyltransferase domain-containing protein [Euryarchaeota archaeon]